MQLTSSTVPADPTLLPVSFPGLAMGAPRAAAPAMEPKASAAGAFGDLFPSLGISPAAVTEPSAESANTAAPTLSVEPQARPAAHTESLTRWEFAPAIAAPLELSGELQTEVATEGEPGAANAFVSHRGPATAKPCEPEHECERDADVVPEERAETASPEVTAVDWIASVVVTPLPLVQPVELTPGAPPESAAQPESMVPTTTGENRAETSRPRPARDELFTHAEDRRGGALVSIVAEDRAGFLGPRPSSVAAVVATEDGRGPSEQISHAGVHEFLQRLTAVSDGNAARAPQIPEDLEPEFESLPRAVVRSLAEVTAHPSLPTAKPSTATATGERTVAPVDVTVPTPTATATPTPTPTPTPSRSLPAYDRFVAEAVERAAPDPFAAERTAPLTVGVNRPATPIVSSPAPVADIASAPVRVDAPEMTEPRTAFPLDGAPLLPPTNGFSSRATDAAANFAASATPELAASEAAPQGPVKSFVNAAQESLTRRRPELGIGVAKANATMPERFLPTLSPHPVSEYGTGVAAVGAGLEISSRQTASAELPAAPIEAVRSAHEAVEVALDAAEVVATGEQPTLDLNFSVGDVELSVHIKVQGDEVHATFRTDSAELRTALAQEWQSVATSSASERGVRLAPATFAGADASALNSSAGNGSPRDDQSHAQRGESSRAAIAALGRSRNRGVESARPAATAIRSLVAAATSRHLHTLA